MLLARLRAGRDITKYRVKDNERYEAKVKSGEGGSDETQSKNPCMKRGFLLCAERVGLIRCFASHPLWGRTHCVRRPHACWHESNPLLGFEPLTNEKSDPHFMKIAFSSGEGGIRTHGTN